MVGAAPREVASPEALRTFLEGLYAPSFFHVSGGEWAGGGSHADMLVAEHWRRLHRHGASSVGRFVSASRAAVWFDAALRILPENPLRSMREPVPDKPPARGRGASTKSRKR